LGWACDVSSRLGGRSCSDHRIARPDGIDLFAGANGARDVKAVGTGNDDFTATSSGREFSRKDTRTRCTVLWDAIQIPAEFRNVGVGRRRDNDVGSEHFWNGDRDDRILGYRRKRNRDWVAEEKSVGAGASDVVGVVALLEIETNGDRAYVSTSSLSGAAS